MRIPFGMTTTSSVAWPPRTWAVGPPGAFSHTQFECATGRPGVEPEQQLVSGMKETAVLRRSGVPGRGASVSAAVHPEPAWQQQRAVRTPNEFSVVGGRGPWCRRQPRRRRRRADERSPPSRVNTIPASDAHGGNDCRHARFLRRTRDKPQPQRVVVDLKRTAGARRTA